MPDLLAPDGRPMHHHLTENLDRSDGTPMREDEIDLGACLPAHETLRRDRHVQRQFRFLLVLTILVSLLLAVRSEIAQNELHEHEQQLRESVHEACEARAEQARVYNEGRRVMIEFVATLDSDQSPEALAFDIAHLREGLLLPVETCPPASLF